MLSYLDIGSLRILDTSAAIQYDLQKIDGLVGLPNIRGTAFDRPENDGGVEPYAQYLSPRIVVIEGEAWPTVQTVAGAFTLYRALLTILESADSTDTLVKWKEVGGTIDKQFTARLTGEVLTSLTDGQAMIPFHIQLRASDPRHYSQTLKSSSVGQPSASGGMPLPVIFPIPFGIGATGGSLTATNAGNTASWPTITLLGPCNGPVITVGSSTLYFDTLNLGAGQTLTITTNPLGRSVTVAGVNSIGTMRFADSVFASLPVGATLVSFYGLGGGTDANTLMTVSFRDAYTS